MTLDDMDRLMKGMTYDEQKRFYSILRTKLAWTDILKYLEDNKIKYNFDRDFTSILCDVDFASDYSQYVEPYIKLHFEEKKKKKI